MFIQENIAASLEQIRGRVVIGCHWNCIVKRLCNEGPIVAFGREQSAASDDDHVLCLATASCRKESNLGMDKIAAAVVVSLALGWAESWR